MSQCRLLFLFSLWHFHNLRVVWLKPGGKTRGGLGMRSEGSSYVAIAEALIRSAVDKRSSSSAASSSSKSARFSRNNDIDIDDNDSLIANWALRERIVSEEHAMDSLDNLLYSMCRFQEVTRRMPGWAVYFCRQPYAACSAEIPSNCQRWRRIDL